jgi:hypothetical protein
MRRSPRLPGDDLEAAAIDASEGEKMMLVMTITSMLHNMETIWVRWITHLIAVVWVHPEVAGVAAASASWLTGREASGVTIAVSWRGLRGHAWVGTPEGLDTPGAFCCVA